MSVAPEFEKSRVVAAMANSDLIYADPLYRQEVLRLLAGLSHRLDPRDRDITLSLWALRADQLVEWQGGHPVTQLTRAGCIAAGVTWEDYEMRLITGARAMVAPT